MTCSMRTRMRRSVSTVAPIRSMTGYALVRRQIAAGELTLTLRSVNHRGLDLHFHPNGQFGPVENAVRDLLKRRIARGHVEIRIALGRDREAEDAAFDREALKRYLTLFRKSCNDFGLDSQPDLNTLFTLPGVFHPVRESASLDDELKSEVIRALEACIDELNAYREREARELSSGFERETAAIEKQAKQIGEIRSNAVPYLLNRVRERLS